MIYWPSKSVWGVRNTLACNGTTELARTGALGRHGKAKLKQGRRKSGDRGGVGHTQEGDSKRQVSPNATGRVWTQVESKSNHRVNEFSDAHTQPDWVCLRKQVLDVSGFEAPWPGACHNGSLMVSSGIRYCRYI